MKSIILKFAAVLALAVCQVAGAQPYPSKPIRIVVPFPPGGSNDIVARILGAKLQESWGQPVVVDNKPGASSVIGNDIVAKSAPDGYTLLINGFGGMVINPFLYPNLPYDGQKGFAPVSLLVDPAMVLGINSAVPATNLREFIAYAKANPDKLNNSAGSTTSQVAAEMFKEMAGVKITSIPYKGSAMAVQAVLAGDVQMVLVDTPAILSQVRAGRIKPLAVSTVKRLSAMPDVPTFAEAGMAEYQMASWVALFAPAGTPIEIVSKIQLEVNRVLNLPDVKAKLGNSSLQVVASTPEFLTNAIRNEGPRYGRIIQSANIKPE